MLCDVTVDWPHSVALSQTFRLRVGDEAAGTCADTIRLVGGWTGVGAGVDGDTGVQKCLQEGLNRV